MPVKHSISTINISWWTSDSCWPYPFDDRYLGYITCHKSHLDPFFLGENQIFVGWFTIQHYRSIPLLIPLSMAKSHNSPVVSRSFPLFTGNISVFFHNFNDGHIERKTHNERKTHKPTLVAQLTIQVHAACMMSTCSSSAAKMLVWWKAACRPWWMISSTKPGWFSGVSWSSCCLDGSMVKPGFKQSIWDGDELGDGELNHTCPWGWSRMWPHEDEELVTQSLNGLKWGVP